jgi:hypothetical protein
MDFGAALKKMKSGKAVTRLGWNGKGQKVWIEKGIADFEQFRGIPPMLLSGVPIDLFNKGLPLVVTTFP